MSGGSQTQTSSSAPWDKAQPGILAGMNDATKLYQSGIGGQTWMGPTTVAPSQQTDRAWQWGENAAHEGANAASGLWNRMQKGWADGGLTDRQRGVGDQLFSMTGTPDEGYRQLNDIQRKAYGLTERIAQGGDMSGNPYAESVLQKSIADASNAARLNASGMGRVGSAAEQSVLTRDIGNLSNDFRYRNFADQQARMDAARADMAGFGNQANAQSEADWARRQYAMDSLTSLEQLGKNNQAGYAGQMADVMGLRQMPMDMLAGIGAQREGVAQNVLDDQLRIFDDLQNKPWEQLARYMGIQSGAGSLGGTSNTVSRQKMGLGNILGGALGLASLF